MGKWGSGRGGRPWRRKVERVKVRDQYTCQLCSRPTEDGECDHIVPLTQGGGDELDNLQWLCVNCHAAKSAIEASEGRRSSTHPDWLPKPACPVVLVTGPSGGGKTTYCRNNAGPADTVIDMDECYRMVCGEHGHTADRKHYNAAMRLRNTQIAELARKRTGTAYLIVSEPIASKVRWWIDKLDATHVLIDPGIDTCLSRVEGRRADNAIAWYNKSSYSTSLSQ